MNNRKLILIVLIATLGGFQFGYQTSVISGAQLFLTHQFGLNTFQEGFLVSIILIGALLGACAAGSLADRFGRKKTLILTCIIFIAGTAIAMSSQTFDMLLAGRFITGTAVGITSLGSPLYLSEISPAEKRGTYVSLNQLMISVGILFAYGINYLFAFDEGWRWMLGLGMVPAIIQGIALPFMPESPTWEKVAKTGKKLVLPGSWRDLLKPNLRFVLVVGILISILQQITGINTVIYYAPRIFEMAGFTSASYAILATLGIGVINVGATIISVKFMDKWGRKKLLNISLIGMFFSLLLLSCAFFAKSEIIDVIAIISQMGYVAFFALGMGPVPWVIISEIYPQNIRGRAMSISIFMNWTFNYLVALSFLDLAAYLTPGGIFLIYAFFSFAGWWFTKHYLPETKKKSLAKIESQLKKTHR